MNKSEFGSINLFDRDDAERNNFVHKCVKREIMKHLRDKWYGLRKFVTNDAIARDIMEDTYKNKPSIMPVGSYKNEEMFIDKYTPAVKTAMSQLRRNSQSLAQRNYMGECRSMSKAFAPFFTTALLTD